MPSKCLEGSRHLERTSNRFCPGKRSREDHRNPFARDSELPWRCSRNGTETCKNSEEIMIKKLCSKLERNYSCELFCSALQSSQLWISNVSSKQIALIHDHARRWLTALHCLKVFLNNLADCQSIHGNSMFESFEKMDSHFDRSIDWTSTVCPLKTSFPVISCSVIL